MSGNGRAATPESVMARKRNNEVNKIKEDRKRGLARNLRDGRAYVRMGRTNTALILGEEDIEDWDEEELIRGKRRDKNGNFQGRAPAVVPKEIHDELVRRTLREGRELVRTSLVPALELLKTVIEDPDAEDRDRIKAATIILDRMLGKPTEHVNVTVEDQPWQDVLVEGLVVLDEAEEDPSVIDVNEV